MQAIRTNGSTEELEEVLTMGPRAGSSELEKALVALTGAVTVLAQAQTQAQPAKPDQRARWLQAIAAVIACLALLATVVRWTSVTEGEFRQQLALQAQKIDTAQTEANRANEEAKLLRTYNDNVRVQFALRGWSIDPQTGVMTKIGRER